ncbi:uncharacterized protein LOC127257848 [Andrographis paniculata]|uniref:uncharacterized protein LOC127257848 n=1 Tax=Andrographis paniculata TaxID=175694 RepID=UPI0021E8A2B1|nr:uncharacterized protein LOC127257848 [Andrographis paniculata]
MPSMASNSIRRPHLAAVDRHLPAEPANLPVEGMEAVVATVSGYHGSERFNLIKLIARAGASYVGNMNQSTTHLVCWKFEGRKHELAKKLKIAIVNHRWIEECVKQGRRVSEDPYRFHSGEEIGPLTLDVPSSTNSAKVQFQASRKKKTVVNIDCDDTNDDPWTDPTVLDEDLYSRPRKKSIRKYSSMDCPSSSIFCLEIPPKPTFVEIDEASPVQTRRSSRQKKVKPTSPAHHSRVRRLVKKHSSEDGLSVDGLPDRNSGGILSDNEVVETHLSSSMRNTSDTRCSSSGQENIDAPEDVTEIGNENSENPNASASAISPLPPTPEDIKKASPEDLAGIHPARLPASNELSCVICWTDFSSTRGVLPCGHRFCFSCIQSWADHMALLKRPSTCPLCKASFICITRVEEAVSSDQKIYSQTIPSLSSQMDLYILPDENHVPPSNQSEMVCCGCFSREPEDLLIRCHFCQVRCVHSYCLDPPLLPWTCIHCKDLQMLYFHNR